VAEVTPRVTSFRWFPYAVAGGAHNMAADEVLLHAAARQGVASLRYYGWSSATVSLGYFQPAAVRKEIGLAALPWVRRPSGGKLLVHHHELTYALALPPGFTGDWMPRMHAQVILPALRRLDIGGQIEVTRQPRSAGAVLCFLQHATGDLTCAGHKIVGSAQRKYRQALLQHGAILLAQSEHTPELPGIRELTQVDCTVSALQAAVLQEFQHDTGWEACQQHWSVAEELQISEFAQQYAGTKWNDKR
jgi:lipoate-protein ligase A